MFIVRDVIPLFFVHYVPIRLGHRLCRPQTTSFTIHAPYCLYCPSFLPSARIRFGPCVFSYAKKLHFFLQNVDFFHFFIHFLGYFKKKLYLCGAKQKFCSIFSPRQGDVLTQVGGNTDILKRRLKRFVLATWNLANSLTTKTLQHKMPMVCIFLSTCIGVHIHTAWASVLLVR